MLGSKVEQVHTTVVTTLRSGSGGLRWLRSGGCGSCLALLLFLSDVVGNALQSW
jgi:hypothetical protein